MQIAKFVRWAASAHSWYKHIPLQDAAVFSFVLDLTVGMKRTQAGFVEQHEVGERPQICMRTCTPICTLTYTRAPYGHTPVASTCACGAESRDAHVGMCAVGSARLASPRLAAPRLTAPHRASPHRASPRLASPRLASPRATLARTTPTSYFLLSTPYVLRPASYSLLAQGDARTHYSWLPTNAYREAFGLLTYRDALPAFQPGCATGPRSVSVQQASAQRVWVPSHLVEIGSCRITAACHGRAEAYQIYHHAYDAYCQARLGSRK